MKRLISILILTLVIVMAAVLSGSAAVMEDYCSAPPYVTRSIPPNIMILLDNSCDMLNAAYDHSAAYNNDTSTHTYTGYFIPNAYYYGGTQNRFKVVEQNLASTAAYIRTAYSGFDIVFKGNFLNYISMSRFDLLQKILTGGNAAVPRQAGGASVVRSSSGSACAGASSSWNWTTVDYSGCVFVVDSGEFRIEDVSAGSCGLLTDLNVARAPSNTFFAWILRKLRLMDAYETLVAKLRGTARFFAKSIEKIDVATKVHAAGPYAVTINTSSPLSAGTVGVSLSRTIQATANNGTAPYYLSFSQSSGSRPPGLNFGTMTCTTPSTDPGSCSITLSGTPSTAGTYYFTMLVTATDSKTPNARVTTITKEFMMTINEATAVNVNITTSTLPSGVVTTTFTNSTAVAIPDLQTVTSDIAVTGLPQADTVATLASVKIDLTHTFDSNLEISLTSPSGTTIKLSDNRGASGANFTDTIFSRTAATAISAGAAPFTGTFIPDEPFTTLTGTANGTWRLTISDQSGADVGALNNWTLAFNPTAATYSQTLSAVASGGTGSFTYTWSVTSGSLPPGLQLNASTGEIYGAPTAAGSYTFTVLVSATDGTVTGTASRDLTIVIGAASGRRTKAYRLWVDVGKDYYNNSLPAELSTGLVQKYWSKAKWGMTNFDQVGNSVKIKVNECIGANNVSTFLNSLDGAVPTNVQSAPLADAYYGVVKYFQNLGQTTEWQGGCQDPFKNDTVPCRKNFILTLSSAYNVYNPGANFSQFESDCPTDYGNSGAKLVQNACYGYKNDQRTATIGASNVAGEQKLYHFAVYTFGADTEPAVDNNGVATNNGRLANKHVLEDAAKASSPIKRFYDASQGVDLQSQLMKAIDDILAQAASGTAVSVLTTSSRGIGSMVQAYFLPATLQETREISWTGYLQNLWIDPTDNLREDTTHDAQLITASESRVDGDKVVKLFFDTNTNETKAATFTTEDDGTGGTLSTCSAPASAIKPFNNVEYLWEAGKSLALRSPSGRKIFTSKVVTRVTSTGTTITTLDGTTNASSPAFTISMDETPMKAALNPDATYTADNIIKYIRGECLETTSPQAFTGDCPSSSPTLNPLFRDRRLKVYSSPTSSVLAFGANQYGNVWKLGDIISSTPKVLANTPLNTYHIDYGDNTYFQYISDTGLDNSYKNRSAIAFVGANDGMVHAFRVGYLKDKGLADAGVKGLFKNFFNSGDSTHDRLGEEVWAYVPYNAFPYLKYLADPGYCHIYYNDLSVRLVDASLGCASDSECDEPGESRKKASWHTVLIGGMRFGGACSGADANPAEPPTGTPASANSGYSSYFAIDITDPENPVPLWEFSDDDMGYSTTFPSVIRTGGRTHNGNWYVAIGSGSKQLPKSSVDIARTNIGHVYFLNLKTGALVKKLDLDDHAGIVGDILGIDADKDYHTEKIYFGTAYNSSGWKGKLAAVDIPNQELSSSSTTTLRYLFTGNNPFTASPDAAKDTDGNVWVYAGSGKYYGDVDEAENVQQIFFGLKDKSSISYPVTESPLTSGFENKTDVNTEGDVTGVSTVCMYDGTGFSNVPIVTSINQTSSVTSAPAVGWFVKLATSPKVERVISRPLAVGGLVDFLTYVPSSSVCDYGGSSYLYSLGFTSGEAPASVAIRASGATTGGGATVGSRVTVQKRVLLGPGAPPSGEAIIVPPPKEDREALKKKIQVATGVIIEAENSPVTSVKSKIIHWLRK